MTELTVLFDVPAEIEYGLMSGAFERVGGVIRSSDRKEVVAWLRDNINLTDETPRQLIPVNLASYIMAGQILQLSITTASLAAINLRLDKLSRQIDNLGELIRTEFNRDRDNTFSTALWVAQQQSNSTEIRQKQALEAISGLRRAYTNFLKDFEEAIKRDALLAQHYLIRAMYASSSYVRCYVDLDELKLAKDNLIQDLATFKGCTKQLINRWFGEYPAIYLHSDFERGDVDRFFKIKLWLNEVDLSNSILTLKTITDIIDELRSDFWNEKVIRLIDPGDVKRLQNRLQKAIGGANNSTDKRTTLLHALTQAEILIENYQRLQGYELELRTMRLSFNAWQDLISENDLQDKELGVIIPTEPVALEKEQ